MNAWETLAADCDLAIRRCHWCHKFGHEMLDCPEYAAWHAKAHVNGSPLLMASPQADSPKEMSGYLVTSWLLFMGLLGGFAWYGILRLAAWALRSLGVHISGI